MNNSIENIGEKIRIERLKADMTQSALAGDRITRNMLSMIESGTALPSLETLEYIANRLDIPAGLFFSADETTESMYNKINLITKAKALYREELYEDCADICKKMGNDDESCVLLAKSYLKLAERDMELNMLKSASEHLRKAKNASERTMYLSEEFEGTIECYETLISFAVSKIDIDKLARISKKKNGIAPSVFSYLTLLYYIDKGETETADSLLSDLPHLMTDQRKYLKAKKLMRDFKFSASLDILLPLCESKELSFISKYRIAADIESCFENKRDFENAYKYSSLKHHILECFSK